MVAGCTHFHCRCPAGRGTIVVNRSWRATAVAHMSVNKIELDLDYLMKWDYIGKWVAWSPEVYHEPSQELRRWE